MDDFSTIKSRFLIFYHLNIFYLCNSSRREVFVVYVRLNPNNYWIRNIVLVIFKQRFEEFAWILKQSFTRFPVVIYLFSGLKV